MIPFASQRGGGQDLASHLMNTYDNEVAEVAHVRGAIASDLHGAFKEWQVQAEALTRCKEYLYSLSINPDPRQGPLTRAQYMDYIARTEDMLGLEEQPRAIVFHTKYGREHCHVVWSRIDAVNGKAVHLAFDHDKLMRVTRAFARDHDLRLPPGYEKSRQKGQESLYEREQKRQTGLSKEDHMRAVTLAWQHSDSARAFVQSLSEKGYLLATGKRPYVLVDLYGGTHALSRLIDDKSVRTADVRAFLEKEFPPQSLPQVEDAIALAERHRAVVERDNDQDRRASALAALKQQQATRRHSLKAERTTLEARHALASVRLAERQRAARDALRHRYLEDRRATLRARAENRPTGLAAFLGKVTGVESLRALIHKHQDAQRLKAFGATLASLKGEQARELRAHDLQAKAEALELARREKALTRVDRRETVAMLRDLRAEGRVLSRGEEGVMPSLANIARIEKAARRARDFTPAHRPGEARESFERAETRSPTELPDLLSAFARAARQQRQERETGGDKAPGLDRMARPSGERDQAQERDRPPDRGRD